MIYKFLKNTFLFVLITMVSCGRTTGQNEPIAAGENTPMEAITAAEPQIITGANLMEIYLPMLEGKKVGLVGNQSSVIFTSTGYTHLVDSLISKNVELIKVFAPEHGFRGTEDAGAVIKDGKDPNTGLPVISLYGDNKKPTREQLRDIEVMIFDLQDVGARFYTYISSLHYVMEACAENNIKIIVLDRPNPNGHYIDGPVLDPAHKSFVGMHPVPVVHGLTMGEYAQMINGEKWLKNGVTCEIEVIKMKNYSHDKPYSLPINPSPNLPNDVAVNLYPSLCFFEGTNVNAGRGTTRQFQVFGSPFLDKEYFNYTYVPQSLPGAKNPKHLGKTCIGKDLSQVERLDRLNLSWLLEAYQNTSDKKQFFNAFFTNLAGGTHLRSQIERGLTEEEIRASWKSGLDNFKLKREQYLLY